MEQYLTPKQLCESCNISIPTLYRAFQRGDLKRIKFGRATRIKLADAENWLNSLQTKGGK